MEENDSIELQTTSKSYLEILVEQFNNENGPPDVNFRAGREIFKVHKKVLEKHSSVLKAKLSDSWQTSGDVLQLDEEYVEPEVVEELLGWMYYVYLSEDMDWDFTTEDVYSLCIAAHYLLISELVTSCCQELHNQIGPDNFYEIYTFSKNLKLDGLRQDCEWSVVNSPETFFLSPQVVKWTTEELTMFIEKSLNVDNKPQVRGTILLSLAIWIQDSIEDRSRELENLVKFVQPEVVSSDALFRFMQTELYSRLDELRRKQYYVRLYLPTGVSSTAKLYCISQRNAFSNLIANCLDLSNGQWSDLPPEPYISVSSQSGWNDIFVVSSGKKIYLSQDLEPSDEPPYFPKKMKPLIYVKVYFTETNKLVYAENGDDSELKSVIESDQPMLAGVALDGYVYITFASKMFNRFCLKTNQWEVLEKLQTARFKHCLVALDGFVYAIGGDVFEADPRPERYDSRAKRWEYIAPTNYHHTLPAAVAHEEQIYVLSQVGFEAYSLETDRWSKLPAPDVCIKPSLVSIAGRLWLLTDLVDCPQIRLVYEFDVVDRKWTRLPDMPEGSYANFALVI